jgi:hypothetical protein
MGDTFVNGFYPFIDVDSGGTIAGLIESANRALVIEGTAQLGYPESAIVPIGVLLLIGVVLYLIPRTSVLGAIYLAGYLGGAVATHVRVGSPLATHVLFPVYVAAFVWGGLALRSPRLLALLKEGR